MVLFVSLLLQPHWSGLTWRGLQLIICILFCLDKKCAITVRTALTFTYYHNVVSDFQPNHGGCRVVAHRGPTRAPGFVIAATG